MATSSVQFPLPRSSFRNVVFTVGIEIFGAVRQGLAARLHVVFLLGIPFLAPSS